MAAVRILLLSLLFLCGGGWCQEINFESVLVEQPKARDGQSGLEVHSRFTLRGLSGRKLLLNAYFYDENSRPLTGRGLFATSSGQLACALSFECPSDYTLFDSRGVPSQTLFLPYREFHLPQGSHQLKVQLCLTAEDNRLLQSSNLASFTYQSSRGD